MHTYLQGVALLLDGCLMNWQLIDG